MKMIQICPECGLPGIRVNEKAVFYNLKKSHKVKNDHQAKWSSCINPECKCSYFKRDRHFTVSELKKPLFYKDKSDNVPICYCADLTRGEIGNAVEKGCKTIGAVRKYTKKNITGHCEKRNPLGKCCNQVFMRTITEVDRK